MAQEQPFSSTTAPQNCPAATSAQGKGQSSHWQSQVLKSSSLGSPEYSWSTAKNITHRANHFSWCENTQENILAQPAKPHGLPTDFKPSNPCQPSWWCGQSLSLLSSLTTVSLCALCWAHFRTTGRADPLLMERRAREGWVISSALTLSLFHPGADAKCCYLLALTCCLKSYFLPP